MRNIFGHKIGTLINDEKYVCPECKEKFRHKKLFNDHIKTHETKFKRRKGMKELPEMNIGPN